MNIASLLLGVALAFPIGSPSAHEASHGASASAGSHASGAYGHPGVAEKASRTVVIVMNDEMRFTPDRVAVKKGETIRFAVRNDGKVEHEMVIGTDATLREHADEMRRTPEMAHDDPNAVRVAPGATGELVWTFDRPGRVSFACLVPGHYEAGMKGSVLVK